MDSHDKRLPIGDLYIGLLGFGTVGSSFAKYLIENRNRCAEETKSKISLEKIFTRTKKKVEDAGYGHLFVSHFEDILHDDSINCVVELIGGIEQTKEILMQLLRAKKHVVTANKALLAHHGKELFDCAHENGVFLAFEASCAGGIPIINALTVGLSANAFSAIYGVVNGTCNFILSEMDKNNLSFKDALKKAMELGLAEADPSLDIEGHDAAHKITIMSTLAYKKIMNINAVPITGITEVQNKDVSFGRKLSYTMKLIAAGIRTGNNISLWVHPAFLMEAHPMTHVEGSFNAISVLGDEVGHTFLYGRGAGGSPTNSAIIADVFSISKGSHRGVSDAVHTNYNNADEPYIHYEQKGIDDFICPVYLRVLVRDSPGTLAKIANILAKKQVSIARVLQEHATALHEKQNNQEKEYADLIIITHAIRFQYILEAKKEFSKLLELIDEPSIYPIIETPKDHL